MMQYPCKLIGELKIIATQQDYTQEITVHQVPPMVKFIDTYNQLSQTRTTKLSDSISSSLCDSST